MLLLHLPFFSLPQKLNKDGSFVGHNSRSFQMTSLNQHTIGSFEFEACGNRFLPAGFAPCLSFCLPLYLSFSNRVCELCHSPSHCLLSFLSCANLRFVRLLEPPFPTCASVLTRVSHLFDRRGGSSTRPCPISPRARCIALCLRSPSTT